jgi:hypothetical protein
VDLPEPRALLRPIDRRGRIGVLDGLDVRLEDDSGHVLEERKDARTHFPGGRRLLYWDALDLTYFLGYAFWGYFALPPLLFRDDIEWREIREGILEARFPSTLPRHSEIQRFYFDQSGLLTRNDYVAEVFSAQAKAANMVLAHGEWNGIPFPSHRRVTPRIKDDQVMGWPKMVGIKVEDWRLVGG